jgi:O-antigen/teichoic acid export membrane protein
VRREAEGARLARNAASSYVVRALLVLSALLVTPYLFRTLGAAGFGTWSVMFTLTTIFNLLELGISAGVVRFVAAARAQDDRAALRVTLGAGVVMMSLVGLGAAAFSVAAAFLLDPLAAAGDRDDFTAGMLVIGAAMLVRFPFVAHGAALNGYQRYDLSNASLAATTVGSALGTVAAVELGAGVFGVAVAHAAALAVGGLLYAILLARLDRDLPLLPRAGTRADLRRIAGFSSYTLLADGMIFIGQRMDVVIIAAIRNAATAAPYAAALKLQSGLQSLTLPLIDMLMPMASDLWTQGRRDEVARRLTLATRATLQATLPVAIGLALFASDLVGLWLGSGAPAVTATIIVVLVAVQAVTLTAFPSEKVLIGVGRVRPIGTLSLVEGLSNVAVSIALTTRYGALGPALGTLFTNAVLAPVRFPLVCRALDWPLGRLLRDGVGAALASTVPAIVVMVAVRLALPEGALRALLGPAAGVAVSCAVAARQVGLARATHVLRGGRSGTATPAQVEKGRST